MGTAGRATPPERNISSKSAQQRIAFHLLSLCDLGRSSVFYQATHGKRRLTCSQRGAALCGGLRDFTFIIKFDVVITFSVCLFFLPAGVLAMGCWLSSCSCRQTHERSLVRAYQFICEPRVYNFCVTTTHLCVCVCVRCPQDSAVRRALTSTVSATASSLCPVSLKHNNALSTT